MHAITWSKEYCRYPVTNVTDVTNVVVSCSHVKDAGPIWACQVGWLELELDHPLGREVCKGCKAGIPGQVKFIPDCEDGCPLPENMIVYIRLAIFVKLPLHPWAILFRVIMVDHHDI